MNAKTQLDFHPDAESLNAFAECALVEEERGQIAAHLAICGRCRQVVFLAQAAGTEEEKLAAASTKRTERRRGAWFGNWWLVWAPAAVLATVVALAFYVHLRRAAVDQEMAKATQEVSPLVRPQNEAVTSRPTETPLNTAAGAAVTGAGVGKPEMKKNPAQVALPPVPREARLPAPSIVNESEPQLATTARPSEAARATQREERASASAMEKGERAQDEMHGTVLTAAAPAFAASARPMAGLAVGASNMPTRVSSDKAALLPSGLLANSTATGSKVTVAVDKGGAVFVSADAGGHWESVTQQWSGQAVAVRMQSNASAVFELVNGQGQLWESTDGRVWTAKRRARTQIF
jgi:hypothetical protein